MFPDITAQPSNGMKYRVASGAVIDNQGVGTAPIEILGGRWLNNFGVSEVIQPLISVHELAAEGHQVVLGRSRPRVEVGAPRRLVCSAPAGAWPFHGHGWNN